MKKVPIRELHVNTSKFAELRPVSPAGLSTQQKARLFTSMEKIWKAMPQVRDSAGIIDDDRTRGFNELD
jgi:hypothetical protein